jgi:hypothetical protein
MKPRTRAVEALELDSEPARQLGRLLLLAGYYGPPVGPPALKPIPRPPRAEPIVHLAKTDTDPLLERDLVLEGLRRDEGRAMVMRRRDAVRAAARAAHAAPKLEAPAPRAAAAARPRPAAPKRAPASSMRAPGAIAGGIAGRILAKLPATEAAAIGGGELAALLPDVSSDSVFAFLSIMRGKGQIQRCGTRGSYRYHKGEP